MTPKSGGRVTGAGLETRVRTRRQKKRPQSGKALSCSRTDAAKEATESAPATDTPAICAATALETRQQLGVVGRGHRVAARPDAVDHPAAARERSRRGPPPWRPLGSVAPTHAVFARSRSCSHRRKKPTVLQHHPHSYRFFDKKNDVEEHF